MYAWQNSIVDEFGRLRVNAHITVRDADTLSLAPIYLDVDGIQQINNPFATRAGFGRFYAAAGRYQITASDDGFERVYEDVPLGFTAAMLPDLTSLVSPLVAELMAPILEQAADIIEAVPELVKFTVLGSGSSIGIPAGWLSERLAAGSYRVNHTRNTTAYLVKLTVWDPGGDRLYSAMMESQSLNDRFEYTVRSIHDTASASDARVDIEITFP